MVEKTTPKVDSIIECDCCGSSFLKKHATKHKRFCAQSLNATNHPFFKSPILVASSDCKVELPASFKTQLSWIKSNLILLHPETMRLCRAKLGQCVLIIQSGKLAVVWPESFLSMLSCRSFSIGSSKSKSSPIDEMISIKFVDNRNAKSIKLKFASRKTFLDHVFTTYLKKYLVGAFVYKDSELAIPYYGQIVRLICTDLDHQDENVKCSGESLINEMSNLNLDSSIHNGDFNISRDELNESNDLINKTISISSEFCPNIDCVFKIDETTEIIIEDCGKNERKLDLSKYFNFNKLGGMTLAKSALKEHLIDPFLAIEKNVNLLKNWKVRSLLIYGPNGCGKTSLINSICSEIDLNLIRFESDDSCSSFLQQYQSQEKLLIVFDDKFNSKENTVLIASICSLIDFSKENPEKILLIAVLAANHENLDSALRRRFDLEVEVGVPSPVERFEILENILKDEFNADIAKIDLVNVAEKAHGFTPADLRNLCTEAGCLAVNRNDFDSADRSYVTWDDLTKSLGKVRPSGMRQIYVEVPKTRWTDIGGQHELKSQLTQAIEWPLTHADAFARLGIRPPSGVLMYGPPGCAKTMVARAIATESGLNFLSVRGPELFSKWVGESEKAVREIFRRARQVAPSVVFFDEIDSLATERSGSNDKSSGVGDRVLAQLLVEMDGVQSLGGVLVVAATNRPDVLDRALLRPGRLDRIVYVPLPDRRARREIVDLARRKTQMDLQDVEFLVNATDGYSGAEVVAVIREAAMMALCADIEASSVAHDHFVAALEKVKPRTDQTRLKFYDDFAKGLFV